MGEPVTPYLNDISGHEAAFGYSVLIGKLFLKNLALSLTYARLPEFEQDNTGEIEAIHHSIMSVGFHLPFSYDE